MTATGERVAAKAAKIEAKGKIATIRVQCTSIGNGMLMNPMTDETLDELLTGVRKQIKKDRKPEDIAKERIYRGDDGRMGVPTMNLVAALNHAGRRVKIGKSAIATAETSTLFSFCEFPTDFIAFDGVDEHGNLPWVVDKRRGVMKNGASKVAVCIVRPKFPSWGFTLELTLDENICSQDTLRKLFEEAGTNAGLGDFRPQKKGPFGRFKVAEWEIVSRREEK